MKLYRRPLVLALLYLATVNAGGQGTQLQIPPVKTTTLAGDTITLPDGLQGKVGILVIGFSRGSQQAVTDWGRRLASDYKESSTVMYYEMPMLASAPRLLRGIILRQMRSSVPERAWPRFAPLTEDEKVWRGLTHYASENDAYVLLVDSRGIVRWQTTGAPTDSIYKELKRQVNAAGPETAAAQKQ